MKQIKHAVIKERPQNKYLKYSSNVITRDDVLIIKKMTEEKADIMDIFIALRHKNPLRDTRTLYSWIEKVNLGKHDNLSNA